MAFPELSSVNSTNDVTQLLVYCNTVTDGYFGPLMLYSFWIVVMGASYFSQIRMTGKTKISICFISASLVSMPVALLMWLEAGLLSYVHIAIMGALIVLGGVWVWIASAYGE
jgi:hypothetical protein